jgi:rhomboid protease GluP
VVSAGGSVFGRLLAALVCPPPEEAEATLVAYRPPIAVVELPGAGTALIVDAGGAPPDGVSDRIQGALATHQFGTLMAIVVGGGDSLRPAILTAQRGAPDPDKLTTYHLGQEGHLERLAGRRSRILERVARGLDGVAPLDAGDVPALLARGQRERDEAARLLSRLRGRFQPATLAILVVCLLLFILAAGWQRGPTADLLMRMGANAGDRVRQGEWWRLLASAFLHGGPTHLYLNLIALGSVGGLVEMVLGWRRYLVLYAASALGGALASAFVLRPPLSVGSSGALWGVTVAALVLGRSRAGLLPPRLARPLSRALIVVLVANLLLSFLPGIDYAAHAGGGMVGFALTASGALPGRRGGRDDRWQVWALGLLAVVAIVGSLALALAAGRPWEASGP